MLVRSVEGRQGGRKKYQIALRYCVCFALSVLLPLPSCVLLRCGLV